MKQKFNSQVCTTVEQSKKLLELGLKPETADMSLSVVCGEELCQWVGKMNNMGTIQVNGIDVPNDQIENIPAWSLHRLMVIGEMEYMCFHDIENAYNTCVRRIEEDIRFGLLNKEYLKE